MVKQNNIAFNLEAGGHSVKVDEDGRLIIVSKGDVQIEGAGRILDARGNLLVPAIEQTNTPNIIASSPTIKSFEAGSAIIRAGMVQLNTISPYLSDLPDSAIAELLVAPQDLAKIDDKGLGRWVSTIERMRDIKGYHGLDGMQIFDGCGTASSPSYEKDWAGQVKVLFAQAHNTGKPVTSGLFLGTKELIHGRKAGQTEITVETNLYSLRDKISKGGDALITKRGSGLAHWQWAASEDPDDPPNVYIVALDGGGVWVRKDNLSLSGRPLGLVLQP